MENEKKYNSDNKIVFYSFIATGQKHAVNELQKIKKKILLSNKTKFSQSFYRDVLYWKKTSCYDDWNTLLYFISTSVVQ